MNILALDTIDDLLSVALETKTGSWYMEADAGMKHSEILLKCIDELFSISGFEKKDLDLVACLEGPGSFTGLRIGFSTAKALSLALGIPYISVPTLDCIAYPVKFWPGLVIPAIDAKKQCFFTAFYRKNERLTDYMDATPQQISTALQKLLLSVNEPVLLTGPAAEMLKTPLINNVQNLELDLHGRCGRAKNLLEIAKNHKIDYNSNNDSGPLYIRKSDAELNHGVDNKTGKLWINDR